MYLISCLFTKSVTLYIYISIHTFIHVIIMVKFQFLLLVNYVYLITCITLNWYLKYLLNIIIYNVLCILLYKFQIENFFHINTFDNLAWTNFRMNYMAVFLFCLDCISYSFRYHLIINRRIRRTLLWWLHIIFFLSDMDDRCWRKVGSEIRNKDWNRTKWSAQVLWASLQRWRWRFKSLVNIFFHIRHWFYVIQFQYVI